MKNLALVVVLLVVGCAGPEGPPGPAGPVGPAGPAGPSAQIKSGRSCSKVDKNWLFMYDVVTYTSNDKFVTCSISTSSAEYGASGVFKSTQNGATNSQCLLSLDADTTATSGYWEFSDTPNPHALYKDSGSTLNGAVVTFAGTDCQSW